MLSILFADMDLILRELGLGHLILEFQANEVSITHVNSNDVKREL